MQCTYASGSDRVESSRTRCNPGPLVACLFIRGSRTRRGGNRRRLNGYFSFGFPVSSWWAQVAPARDLYVAFLVAPPSIFPVSGVGTHDRNRYSTHARRTSPLPSHHPIFRRPAGAMIDLALKSELRLTASRSSRLYSCLIRQ